MQEQRVLVPWLLRKHVRKNTNRELYCFCFRQLVGVFVFLAHIFVANFVVLFQCFQHNFLSSNTKVVAFGRENAKTVFKQLQGQLLFQLKFAMSLPQKRLASFQNFATQVESNVRFLLSTPFRQSDMYCISLFNARVSMREM